MGLRPTVVLVHLPADEQQCNGEGRAGHQGTARAGQVAPIRRPHHRARCGTDHVAGFVKARIDAHSMREGSCLRSGLAPQSDVRSASAQLGPTASGLLLPARQPFADRRDQVIVRELIVLPLLGHFGGRSVRLLRRGSSRPAGITGVSRRVSASRTRISDSKRAGVVAVAGRVEQLVSRADVTLDVRARSGQQGGQHPTRRLGMETMLGRRRLPRRRSRRGTGRRCRRFPPDPPGWRWSTGGP